MTDTEVKINGQDVGPTHRGGFYEFKYDITSFVVYGTENLLEVKVSKHSANNSVNNAERKADWWLFGGIYRPVWLEISPKSHIAHFATDPKMDGTLNAQVEIENMPINPSIEFSIMQDGSQETFHEQELKLDQNQKKHSLSVKWDDILTWSPEHPNLYVLTLKLKSSNKTVHTSSTKIGFRTLEFIKKDGIYVNGKKILMKGVNRHTIWPESGRSTDKEISVMDVNLIKDMNMNAVRFHYPPDTHFLEACDSLGLFVLNELAGWQNGYDTEVGRQLIKETVQRDVNHPSVIIWDHGNEGGWNYEIDQVFHQYDPQKRIVIHPWSDFDGWDTHHYPTYLTGMHRFNNGENVFFPTEFMHGTYDNGLGAGLDDFWTRYKKSPLFAGGFLWALLDEAVLRTDWNGGKKYDAKGNLAADGILGPHREKEGSFFTIKEVWAPIQFEPKKISQKFDGSFSVRNEFLFTNLNQCEFNYKVIKLQSPFDIERNKVILNQGKIPVISIDPGETRKIQFTLPQDFFDGDWLEIQALDPFKREIFTWSWPIHDAKYYTDSLITSTKSNGEAIVKRDGDLITLSNQSVEVKINAHTGKIKQILSPQGQIPLTNGPTPVGTKAVVDGLTIRNENGYAECEFKYSGGINKAKWTLFDDGRLKLALVMLKNTPRIEGFDGPVIDSSINLFGITFDYPESGVKLFSWLGNGPYRVWKNRLKGARFGYWEKTYNNTITGESFENLIYPEFKGYHANFVAGKISSEVGDLNVFSENDKLFLRLFTPDMPKNNVSKVYPQPSFPQGNISFLYEIPAMRAFKPLSQQGPESQPTNIRIKSGDEGIPMTLWFDFRSQNELIK